MSQGNPKSSEWFIGYKSNEHDRKFTVVKLRNTKEDGISIVVSVVVICTFVS